MKHVRIPVIRSVLGLTLACFGVACGSGEQPPTETSEQPLHLTPRARLADANGNFVGTVVFLPGPGGSSVVSAAVRVDPALEGFHGIHVHANDNPANGVGCVADPAQPANTHFVSADGHFTIPGNIHGDHIGDMPALLVNDDGTAAMSFVTGRFSPSEVVGRAMILHAAPDNYANIPVGAGPTQYTPNSPEATALTNATGNAGNRIACGVIQ
jgi:Cu-Zn family superoxide dismutase